MKKITAIAATALTAATLLSAAAPNAAALHPAQPHPWDHRAKCNTTDADGRKIPTRYGNADFGWKHFTNRHNIKTCRIVNEALEGNPDSDDHHGRLEYDGDAIRTGPNPAHVKYVVIVQYSRKTKDGKYDAGRGQKIGVINAFCRNQPQNKCPAWMNQ